MRLVCSAALIGGILVASAPAAETAEPPLTVCLEEDSPPYSYKFGKNKIGGFDLAIAEALAERLDRTLDILWFEFEDDEEEVPMWQSSALLAERLCDLIGGYALFSAMLGTPVQPMSKLPDYRGGKRGVRVPTKPIAATRPYHRAPFAVILGPGAGGRKIAKLEDLKGLRIGAEVSTISSAILFRHGHGMLIPDLANIAPTKGLLKQADAGRFDAVMIELHRFDWYRKRAPETTLRWSGYVHPIGFNIGFAALEEAQDLIAQVDAAIDEMRGDGTIARLAGEAGMTYRPPKAPTILHRITPAMLVGG